MKSFLGRGYIEMSARMTGDGSLSRQGNRRAGDRLRGSKKFKGTGNPQTTF